MLRYRLVLSLLAFLLGVVDGRNLLAQASFSQAIPFVRLRRPALRVPMPGVALITDSTVLALLWRRFATMGVGPNGSVGDATPKVDFAKNSVVAVSLGPYDGCLPSTYIRSIEATRDSLVVIYGYPDLPPGTLSCAWVEWPVDVVVIARTGVPLTARPVRGHRAVSKAPSWWDNVGVAEIARVPEEHRQAFLIAHALDPRTSLGQLTALADWAGPRGDYFLASYLVADPRVRASPRALASLTGAADNVGRTAWSMLKNYPAEVFAVDTGMPMLTYRAMIERITHLSGDSALAGALSRNPVIQKDSSLLIRLVIKAQFFSGPCNAALESLRHGWFPDTTSQEYWGVAGFCRYHEGKRR